MFIKRVFIILIILGSFISIFSAEGLQCKWVSASSCTDSRDTLFYLPSQIFNNSQHGQPNEFMSAHLSYTDVLSYDTALCCTLSSNSPADRLSFYHETTTNDQCTNLDDQAIYSTASINGIVATNFTSTHHNSLLCVDLPTSISNVDMRHSYFESEGNNLRNKGYQCIFRISNETNGRISSCEASYLDNTVFPVVSGQYPIGVWIRVFESISSLRCNADCTSKLDNRVYSSCATKITACRDVPLACDGSLYGGWVSLNTSDKDTFGNYKTQIRCEAPWSQTRINPEYIENSADSIINIEGETDSCSELISQEYSVLVYNIPYKMKVYVCNNE